MTRLPSTRLTSWMLPLVLCACAATPAPSTPVPPPLQPGADYRQAFSLLGKGVQIYRCDNASGALKWVFVAPRAQLLDASGKEAGTHGAGPFWQGTDGSRIVGKPLQSVPSPNAGSIPWLLLAASNDGPAGKFSSVSRVQRLETAGGVAPASGCDSPADQGRTVEVAYTATYVFFVPG